MKRGLPQGYTILEVMIFLAVTTALFVMVAITFQGRQARTEFSAAARDMESAVRDIVNDMNTGYTASQEDFACRNVAGVPVFDNTEANTLGTSGDCVFFGRVIHFGVTGNNEVYQVSSVAGVRKTQEGKDPKDVVDIRPQVIPSSVEEIRLPVGLTFGGMSIGSANKLSAVGFLHLNTMNSGVGTGNISTATVPLALGSATSTREEVESAVNGLGIVPDGETKSDYLNRVTLSLAIDSVRICFVGDASDQHAILTIAGISGNSEVDMVIGEGRSCPGF